MEGLSVKIVIANRKLQTSHVDHNIQFNPWKDGTLQLSSPEYLVVKLPKNCEESKSYLPIIKGST